MKNDPNVLTDDISIGSTHFLNYVLLKSCQDELYLLFTENFL